jgi:hypothetical protein
MLFIFTPDGFEELIREMSEPARTRTLPPPVSKMVAVRRRGDRPPSAGA